MDQITAHDYEVCANLEKKMRDFVDFAQEYITLAQKAPSCNWADWEYSKSAHIVEGMIKQIEQVCDNFINNVRYHFHDTYHINTERTKMNLAIDGSTTLEMVISEIIKQLNGVSFGDMALQQLKDNLKHTLSSYNHLNITKSKVTIENYISWHSNWRGESNINGNTFGYLLSAISHFETGSIDISGQLSLIGNGGYRNDWFSKFTFPTLTKFNGIRFYKNHKVELWFKSAAFAEQFAREYLHWDGGAA
jgi:hypothetical protein